MTIINVIDHLIEPMCGFKFSPLFFLSPCFYVTVIISLCLWLILFALLSQTYKWKLGHEFETFNFSSMSYHIIRCYIYSDLSLSFIQ